jgi:uncharacterized LabA/DUF88 family protein
LITNVYIDAFNLYYGCLKHTPFKWVDLNKLCHYLLPNNKINKIKYFTALVNDRVDRPGSNSRQLIYLRALHTLSNVEIIKGHYLSNRVRMPTYASVKNYAPGKTIELVDVMKSEEKGSDVNLAVHLLKDAYEKAYQCAVVISNDSDLLEPIRIVKEELKIPVGLINPHQYPSKVLFKVASFFKQIRSGVLSVSQFPDTLKDAVGDFHKPPTW